MIKQFTYATATYCGLPGAHKPLPEENYRIGLSPLPHPEYMTVGIERGPRKSNNEPISHLTYDNQEGFWRDWKNVVDDEGKPIIL